MKFIKKGLAFMLAAMLVIPSLSAAAAEIPAAEAAAGTELVSGSQEQIELIAEETPAEEEITAEKTTAAESNAEGENSEEKKPSDQATEQSPSDSSSEQGLSSTTESPSEDTGATAGGTESSSTGTSVEEGTSGEVSQEGDPEEKTTEETIETEEEATETTEEETEETAEEETTEDAEEKAAEPSEEIRFNTGSGSFGVVSREDFFDNELGDACFEEDGSYTINIPEANPFFPYEVQFTYEGNTTKEWFMTPEDSVEIGGHTFYVSAYFDGTRVTQMSLKVGDDTVVVYPEEKEFSEGDGIMPLSLLPLEEVSLNVDLSGYTPAELTMVSVDKIFTGDKALMDMDRVMWTHIGEDDYTVSASGDVIDLSYETYYSYSKTWEMIVGDDDQLASDNIRYIVSVRNTASRSWLKPTVYTQDTGGTRSNVKVTDYEYYDYDEASRRLDIDLNADGYDASAQTYLGLAVNEEVFASVNYDHLKVYEGNFTSLQEAMSAPEITDQIMAADMTGRDAGYLINVEQYRSQWITIVTFDAAGNATGCLPLFLDLTAPGTYFGVSICDVPGVERESVYWSYSRSQSNGQDSKIAAELYKGYSASETYYTTLTFYQDGKSNTALVDAAYAGNYASKAEAEAAGAEDIKTALFGLDYSNRGYGADYSQGVTFTVIVNAGTDGSPAVYHVTVSVKEGNREKYNSLNSGTKGWFRGLKDGEGNPVDSYVVGVREDSYAEFNYLTILVGQDVDLTSLAPVFTMDEGMKLYTAGSSTEEISGVSVHDFSNGPVQYSAAAENGTDSKNYWLQVVKATDGAGWLYVNSLADSDSETRTEGGITYSTREIVLDGYHDNVHDILLANMGTEAISNPVVELSSDALELDGYWTLSGKYELAGFSTTTKAATYGELPNLAKVRLKAKGERGSDISGTLTIKDGSKTLMVLTLTGTIGDPCIVTKEIPEAVKYVPYGTMIQNNNKYDWNTISYRLMSGSLPGGMVVKENGEIYGVPTEAGEFTFRVMMMAEGPSSSYYDYMTYTLVVLENTDPNVDGATDTGYDLTQRIPNVRADLSESHTMVSTGVYGEFVDVYIDGEKLEEGTDYTSESGSTRITIWSQALVGSRAAGTHTIGVEFRTEDTDILKRAAQNYVIEGTNQGGSDSGSSSGSSSGSDSSAGSDSTAGNSAALASPANGTGAVAAEGLAGLTGAAGEEAAVVSYTVEKGDSLWKIAEKFYGSGTYWQKIYQDNAAVISDPNKIYVGQVLSIYLIPTGSITGETDQNVTYYTVEKGDSLWKIAVKFYGRSWRWRKIFDANDSITDPGRIYEGQVIIIPQ